MRKTTVAAFLTTVLVAVPAGWTLLGANIQTDGPGVRPDKQRIEVEDGVVFDLQLDRGVTTAGGRVTAILTATSATPREVALDVRALEDNGYGEERVRNPPTVLSKRRVKVKAGPGGIASEVAFSLGTTRAKGVVQWIDIDVSPAGARFDRKDEVSHGARAGYAVWGGNSFPITIEPPAAIPASGPFDVGVRVKNTRRKPIQYLDVSLGNQLGLEGLSSELIVSSYGEDAPYTAEWLGADTDGDELAPGAERVYRFRVTPRSDAVRAFTLMAHAHGGGTGAVEITTLTRPDAAPGAGLHAAAVP